MSQLVYFGVISVKLGVLPLALISCPCFSVNLPQGIFHFICVFILAPFLYFLSASAVWTAWKDGFCLESKIPLRFVLEGGNLYARCIWESLFATVSQGRCAPSPFPSLCRLQQKGFYLCFPLSCLCVLFLVQMKMVSTDRPCKDIFRFHMALNANERFVASFMSLVSKQFHHRCIQRRKLLIKCYASPLPFGTCFSLLVRCFWHSNQSFILLEGVFIHVCV